MKSRHTANGFTLVEIMMAMAILAILASLAIPIYSQYVRESEISTARLNMDSLRLFVEDYFLDNLTYVGAEGQWTADESVTTLRDSLNWEPSGDSNLYDYTVTTNAAVGGGSTYAIVVENVSAEVWVRCQDRMNTCCTSETPGATRGACP